jgi:membrane-bound metal-dependent hydrolase YbcI (DUF457 family)
MGLVCYLLASLIPQQTMDIVGGSDRLPLIAFFLGFLGIINHIVGDAITPMGIRPFSLWVLNDVPPFKKHKNKFRKRLRFKLVRASNPVANRLLLQAGIFIITLVTVVSLLKNFGLLWDTIDLIVGFFESLYELYNETNRF